jgi:hypothetical protein
MDSLPEYVRIQCVIRNAGRLCPGPVRPVERRMLPNLSLDSRQRCGAGAFQPKRAL